ncbi:MAG TPA: hypothetical protein VLL72_11920 [Kiloniellales bacterium]|nr:hypothetical protein [Kiloniellales bacterium]
MMVLDGFALAYYGHKYRAEESIARQEQAGLWSGTFVTPWDWRKQQAAPTAQELLDRLRRGPEAQQSVTGPNTPKSALHS